MSIHEKESERGFVVVMFALVVAILCVIAALAVGLGNVRQTRRDLQNDVDAALLAAAIELDGLLTTSEEGVAVKRACEYLAANGVIDESCGAHLFDYPVNADGLPATGDDDECIAASRSTAAQAWFAGVLGPDAETVTVNASAAACRGLGEPGGANISFFSGGECKVGDTGKAFVYSGNSNWHEGDLHSNWDVKLNGASNRFIGRRTYVQDPLDDPNGLWAENSDGPAAEKVPSKAWPSETADFTLAALGPNSSFATSLGTGSPATAGVHYYDLTGSDIRHDTVGTLVGGMWQIRAGVYFTDQTIQFGDKVVIVDKDGHSGATFISSTGAIIVSSTGSTFRAFDESPHRLAFFAAWDENPSDDDNNCDSQTFSLSGNCNHIDGVVYAPYGKISWGGEGNGQDSVPGSSCAARPGSASFTGAFVGWAFQFSGNYSLTRAGLGDEALREARVFLSK